MNSLKDYNLYSLMSIAPKCNRCQSMMRPDVVMFGEAVQELPRAYQIAKDCDVMLVLGTSGAVYPAASFPAEASKSGARIIVINPTENAFSSVTDVYIPMKTGEALPAIIKKIRDLAS